MMLFVSFLLACEPNDEVDPIGQGGSMGDTAADGDLDTGGVDTELTPPPMRSRDDLPPCDERTRPIYEDFDPPGTPIDRVWGQYESVLICPGDQLGFLHAHSYAWDGLDLVVVDGVATELQVRIGYREPYRVDAERTEQGFHIPRDPYSKTCNTATYPVIVALPEGAEPVQFDLLVGPDTGDRCTNTG